VTESEPIHSESKPQLPAKEEFLDAVQRHICQVLGFDFGFIEIIDGHEIHSLVSFSADADGENDTRLVQGLVDENKQPLVIANSLLAQKVKTSLRPWIGKAYGPQDKDDENQLKEYPYAIVPVLSDWQKLASVRGLIRVLCFDCDKEITHQDLTTLKLMGEHLANRTQLFAQQKPEEENRTIKPNLLPQEMAQADAVLILHANRLVRRRFSRILQSHYRVFECDSQERSLQILAENKVDLVIVDSDLPETSGFAFAKVIKDSPDYKHIPIIIVTPDTNPTYRVEALNVGADDSLSDACFDTEILARAQSSLRHRKTEKELAVQLQLLEDYAQRLEKAHEKLSQDKQTQMQRNALLEQLRRESDIGRNQDSLLHRISNTIRRSFTIKENLSEMLEELSGYFALDGCFAVMPSLEEPEDTIRLEYITDDCYRVIEFNKDLQLLEAYREHWHNDQALIANDVVNDRRLDILRETFLAPYNLSSLFVIPVTYSDSLLGLLVGFKGANHASWNRQNETFMKSVADQVASGVTNARLYARVQRQAVTDGLTTLFNHRTGQEKLTEQMRMAERYQRHLSVVMVDVDFFKKINDNYGHPVGDTVLKAVAKLIKNNCRDVDIPIRYGGEEFMVVLPEVNTEGAHVVAERIRRSLAQEVIMHENISLSVTASIGISTFPDDAGEQKQLLALADKALYLSKRLGRNQVRTVADLMFENQKGENLEASVDTRESAPEARVAAESFVVPTVSVEAQSKEELVPEVVDMVKVLAQSLYARSDYNKAHHLEVARMSELLGRVMGLSSTQIEQLRVAGLLHDVGTLRIPSDILEKSGSFTAAERETVNLHPILGAQMLRPIRALKDICEILENHHERWDGTGYPQGLSGESIPLAARIVSIVDSYHALISQRPYRKALSEEEAVATLKEGAGKQWDPFLIDIFIAVLKSAKQS
jgi:diguanylate cyclase (GGDEF)-like protein/putative nucleotidyltransferase with HDIG domain